MPNCPKCGKAMVLRTARQGSRSGSQFYGCSSFPKCRGTLAKSRTSSPARKSASKPSTKSTAPSASRERVATVAPRKPIDPVMQSLVQSAVKGWVENLVDFSRNNNLLFYRDTKTTTLDLSHADPEQLTKLYAGESVSFQDLFSRLELLGSEGDILKKEVASRIQKIRSKAQENFEERSIGTLSLGRGFATWQIPDATQDERPPRAPIFIFGLDIKPGKRKGDLTVSTSGDPELNPVLQIYLKREFGVDAQLPEFDSHEEGGSFESVLQELKRQWSEVPSLSIDSSAAISNFSYAKLSMVQDLEAGIDDLSQHQLILALAGDAKAQEIVRDQVTDIDLGLPNLVQPMNEFLVLDADSSQNEVINAMVAGQSFVVEGPPGTGKSQTIANSIACLVAEGKKVLFVAEKRAAIDAVVRRLSGVGLEQLVMDFHGAGKKRRDVLDQLGQTINAVSTVQLGVPEQAFESLVDARQSLIDHNKALFEIYEPWGLSLYDILLVGSPASDIGHVGFRLRLTELRRILPIQLRECESNFALYQQYGGFVKSPHADVWRNAGLKSQEGVTDVLNALRGIKAGNLDRFLLAYREATALLGVDFDDLLMRRNLVSLLGEMDSFQKAYGHEVLGSGLDSCSEVLCQKNSTLNLKLAGWFSPGFRRIVREAKKHFHTELSVVKLRDVLLERGRIRSAWFGLLPNSGNPHTVSRSVKLQDLMSSARQLDDLKRDLSGFPDLLMAVDGNSAMAMEMASKLLEFESIGRGVVECLKLRDGFDDLGLLPLISEIQNMDLDRITPGEVLRYVWAKSLAEHIQTVAPSLSSTNRDGLDSAVRTFASDDVRHLKQKPDQIIRLWASRFRETRLEFPKQEQALLASINRKRKLPGLSRVFGEAPDVISALKPCWVMSPLSVSMLRPPSEWFDVVIFDEASQIPPADAMTSIKAAKQMVIAGDSLQLPPTPFFAAGDSGTDDSFDNEEFEESSISADYESILDFVKMIIPKYRQLRWHYRSRDERLIAFSNYKLYKSLVAFPYSGADTTLEHVAIPFTEKSIGRGATNTAEVSVVVDLVLRHVENRPQESLGVIALGLKHSAAIEDALSSLRITHVALDRFMSEEHNGEPFFIKNLERVQGDERDCIILSIGYGRGESGQVKYTFGPILGSKGERRLNVATTRAKLRMCTVATFGSGDLDATKTSKGGAAFLREYLAFVESEGKKLPDKGSTRVEMNPFEQSVYDQLTRRGIMLLPQYGVGNYRLDFAVQNPNKPGAFVMAIECDGRSYHSFPTARERDRLREAALRARGWDFHRIWSDHWFANPEVEVERALAAIHKSFAAN